MNQRDKVGKNDSSYLLSDLLPDDPRHLVSIELDDWVLDGNLLKA